jgi:pyruvate/2-oxoglutarate dehydrogenase complex dihydrolipoamide dehydrogenase (E3) component
LEGFVSTKDVFLVSLSFQLLIVSKKSTRLGRLELEQKLQVLIFSAFNHGKMKSMMVIGGGSIGIQLGQTFAKFGTKVTVIEGSNQILPLFEAEVVRWVQRKLKKDGVEIFTNSTFADRNT